MYSLTWRIWLEIAACSGAGNDVFSPDVARSSLDWPSPAQRSGAFADSSAPLRIALAHFTIKCVTLGHRASVSNGGSTASLNSHSLRASESPSPLDISPVIKLSLNV